MSIDVSVSEDPAEWNGLVERSPQLTPFHRFEALRVVADHSGTTVHPLVGYKGEEPVGVFPVFSMRRGPVRAVFSPPPDLKINYLGPVVFTQENMKQRKTERRQRRFIEAVDELITDRLDPQYTLVRTGPNYSDPRPFIWNGYDPSPRYTYEVDLTPPTEELFMTFSSDIRSNVRNTDERSYELSEGGASEIEQIISWAQERHDEQDVAFNVSQSFARDLYRALPDRTMRAYVCRSGGVFVGGEITLEDERTLYKWQAVGDYDHDVPASDLLDWHVIQAARERDIKRFDLLGANNPRLCEYKAKYNPEVRIYYELERSNPIMDVMKAVYRRVR